MVTLIGAISFVKQNPAQNKIEAAADVEIGSWDDLENFAASVALGNSYEGQTVVLTNNINCKNERIGIGYCRDDIPPVTNVYFKGSVFDGQGFSIYNFQLTTARFYGGTADAFGLFSRIDSKTTIRNLKLETYQFTVEEIQKTSDYGQTTGGIVGYLAGGTIENCMVEDFTVNANYTASENNKMGVGGIFGVGWGTVNNCHVKGIKQTGVYRMAGIGPADCPYTVSHGTFGDTQLHVYYPNTPSTITNCVVQDVASATINYPIAKDKNAGTGRTFGSSGDLPDEWETYKYEHNNGQGFSTCQTSPGEPPVSSWSAAGGEFQSTIWYYGGPYFNDGYPCPRLYFHSMFTISGYWCLIDFLIEPEGCGEIVGETVENSTIQAEYSAAWNSIYAYKVLDLTSETLKICGQEITAEPSVGYQFDCWEIGDEIIFPEDYPDDWRIDTKQILIAKFKRASLYTLTFENATGVESGVTISPKENGINVSGQSYTVYHGEQIKASPTSGDGPLTLKYTFNNSEGVECVVTYTIGEKYKLSDSKSPGIITEGTTIEPEVAIKTFTVTFEISDGSEMCVLETENGTEVKQDSEYSLTYKYDGKMGINVNNKGDVSFFGSNSIEGIYGIKYDVDTSNYICKNIKLDYETLTDQSITATSSTYKEEYIKDNVTISLEIEKLIELTFKPVENAELKCDNEVKTETVTIKVESGNTINTRYSKKELVYNVTGGSIITYTAEQYYAITVYKNYNSVPTKNTDMTPKVERFACTITMTKTDLDNVAIMSISGENYETANDGIFVVEYGTTIDFEAKSLGEGLFEYVYTFKYGNETVATITYKTENNQYAMSSEMSGGNRKWHTQISSDHKTKDEIKETYGTEETISPEFEKKFYDGNLA